MSIHDTEIFLDGFKFTEGLRWHDGHLWFCDLWDHKVYCFNAKGIKTKEILINDDEPVGLGWLSDGSLLITSLMKRKLLQYSEGQLTVYKDLDMASPGYCHDFTVSKDDIVYLSASGFYPEHNVKPVKSNILMIMPDKEIKIAASEIGYPNGIVITPDGKHLLVAETFAASILSFEINKDFSLCNRKMWGKLDDLGFAASFDENGIPEDKDRHYPDGISYDSELNAVWVASPGRKEIICVNHHGKVIQTIKTLSVPFDCLLMGEDKRMLYVASSDMIEGERTGKIEQVHV